MTATGGRLQPLRPSTYRANRSRRLADVTVPPIEVWDDDEVRRLAARRADHVLNVLVPGSGPPPGDGAWGTATLDRWRSEGVVEVAEVASLYGWSWEVQGRSVRGVAGAVALPAGDRLVPHERVRPDIVAARAAGLARSGVQAEPIVILHDGDPLGLDAAPPAAAASVVDLAMADERHRLWPLRDQDQVAALAAVLSAAAAPVVADGHHRLAALDRLVALDRQVGPDQLAGRDVGGGHEITHGLVLLVDVGASDLTVRTIHRVAPDLDVGRVAASTGTQLEPVPYGEEAAYLQAAAPSHLRYLLADQTRQLGLDLSVEAVHALHPGQGPSCSPVARDTCHLHSHLLPAWRVPETDLRYVHDWTQARRTASAEAGLAIATAAPGLSDVLAAARGGHLLPHKATSIGPKPRVGLLMFDGRSVDTSSVGITRGAAPP